LLLVLLLEVRGREGRYSVLAFAFAFASFAFGVVEDNNYVEVKRGGR
jgi:hypothetical protein